MAFIEVEHPIGMTPLNEVRAKADKAFQEIVSKATGWKVSPESVAKLEPAYPAKRIQFNGTYEALNRFFYQKGWSLGLPIIPPTTEAVQAMLKGTKRSPDEVVWVVPPRQGQLTVELVAAIGAMSNCKPEHMPLLLAIVKALSDPAYDWRGNTTTTAPTAPLVIINGPIIKKLGIGYSTGLLGGESPVNIALGYFINLVGDIVGGSTPPEIDKSTQGSREDLVAIVLGENEDQNPWKQSYAEEQGFRKTDNVVTAYGTYMGTNNVDHMAVKGAQLLDTLAMSVAAAPTGITSCLTKLGPPEGVKNAISFTFLLLGPEHAKTIANDFTKQGAKEYLIKKAVMPFWSYAAGMCTVPKEFGPYDANTMIPRFTQPEQIKIVVTGGAGKQSQIWPTFYTNLKPVSLLVEE